MLRDGSPAFCARWLNRPPHHEGFPRTPTGSAAQRIPASGPSNKPRPLRLARHYYDLWCLLRAGVGQRALADRELFARVVEHRKFFFRYSWVDYGTHRAGQFRLLPASGDLNAWTADYEAMRGAMFFADSPSFDEILKVVGEFEQSFNSGV